MVQRTELRLAKSLKQLKELVPPQNEIKLSGSSSVNILQKLYRDAQAKLASGDEEYAFVLFMRFAELAMKTEDRAPELKTNIVVSLDECERLSKSLNKRYQDLAEDEIEKSLSSLPPPPPGAIDRSELPNGLNKTSIEPKASTTDVPEISSARMDQPVPPATVPVGDFDSPTLLAKYPNYIAAKDLRSRLDSGRILVIDCRSAEAFADSHISSSKNVINVAKVYMGVTASAIENSLEGHAKSLFANRKSFEKVVLVDWDGSQWNSPASKVAKVNEAVTKWVNVEDSIICSYLEHGYNFWCKAFPHDTTNSRPKEELNTEKVNVQTIFENGANLYQIDRLQPEAPERPKVVPPRTPPQDPVTVMIKPVAPPPPPVEAIVPMKVIPKPSEKPPVENPVSAKLKEEQEKCKELFTKVDQTTQLTVSQFNKSVNEKILAETKKPRTRSEAETPDRLPSDQRSLKPILVRSRSLSDIYEDSNNREVFERTNEREHAKKPLIDRALKPSTSLDTATVHKVKDSTKEVVAPSTRPELKVVPTRPVIPPKSRRSQSPVQAYRFGLNDRTSGLRNLRNTCYMNSVLQALAHSAEFAQYFVCREHESKRLEPKRAVLPSLFSRLLGQLWSQNDTRDSLVQFRNCIGSRIPMYQSSEQQDSHEFLVNLLTALHDDLNAPTTTTKATVDNPDLVVTFAMLATELDRFYISHSERQMSVVTRNYEGILLSGLKCHTCHSDSYTFQVFTVLSVPIPSWREVDIQACFDQFFREEDVDEWLCPCCKTKRTATKQMKIARLPKHLIVHLVRFKNDTWASAFSSLKKIPNKVLFTDELDTRDFAQYVYSKSVQLRSYSLYGVVKHYGSLSTGHYYSECRFLPNMQWYRYNDNEVTSISRKFPEVDDTYMLFYSCENYRNEQ